MDRISLGVVSTQGPPKKGSFLVINNSTHNCAVLEEIFVSGEAGVPMTGELSFPTAAAKPSSLMSTFTGGWYSLSLLIPPKEHVALPVVFSPSGNRVGTFGGTVSFHFNSRSIVMSRSFEVTVLTPEDAETCNSVFNARAPRFVPASLRAIWSSKPLIMCAPVVVSSSPLCNWFPAF